METPKTSHRYFTCFLCKTEFEVTTAPVEHYQEITTQEETVSLCDICMAEAQKRAIELGLQDQVSEGFFIN